MPLENDTHKHPIYCRSLKIPNYDLLEVPERASCDNY